MIFGLKVGLSIGGAIGAALLATYGYVAEATQQTDSTINGIRMSVSIYPGLVFIIGTALLSGYKLDKKMELKIESDLKEKRNKMNNPQ